MPAWKPSHEKANKEHFLNLRLDFRKNVQLVLQQAKHNDCCSIVFSTEKLNDAEFAYPLDVIADVLLTELLLMFEPDGNSLTKKAEKNSFKVVDVYIAEPKCNAVFKAFNYFIIKYSGKIEGPDQSSWDKICLKGIFKRKNIFV